MDANASDSTPDTSMRSDASASGPDCKILLTVMRDVGTMMDVQDELSDIKAAEEAVVKKDEARARIVDKLQDDLRLLAAQCQEASAAAQRPKGTPSAAEHETHVRDLEARQYAVGKALNEEQANIAKKEVELGRVKAEREEVRKWDPTAGDGGDTHVLRLKMFKEMGFTLLDSKPARILVRNDARPDVQVHTVDMANRVKSANLLWEYAG